VSPEEQLFQDQLDAWGLDPASLIAAVIVALGILYFARRSRRAYLKLPELHHSNSPAPVADVSVVIPARNEEEVVARAVASFAGTEVLVVDDHSRDRTAERARAAGARVIQAAPLAAGWLGKSNACWSGAQGTGSSWLLFADADSWYSPEFLPALVSYAQAEKLQCVTIFPRQEYASPSERMLLPYAFGLYFSGVDAEAVNRPRSSEALANGQCMLFRREPYLFLQGHRAVAGSVLEDIALAHLAKRHRMSIRVMRCESMASVRMYDSFGEMWRGLEKGLFRMLQANPKTGYQVLLASIFMVSWLPVLLWLLGARQWAAAALFCCVPVLAWAPWYGGVLRSWRAVPAIYVCLMAAVSSMAKRLLGLKTTWKGRRV
jgi:cellulose synthase/poly-beta-1,6-N-acetylglucosamine synthase-like glycosyltransferase